MSKFKIIVALMLVGLICSISLADDETIAKVHTKIYKEASPSVVGTICGGSLQGTGVIIDERGYIITSTTSTGTNYDALYVFLKGNKRYSGKVIKVVKEKDLVIIKIDAKGLKAIKLGDSDKAQGGDIVYSLSDSFSSIKTDDQVAMSLGAINGTGKVKKAQAKDSHYDGQVFKTTAAINPNGAGAAILNSKGELIGLGTLNYDETDFSYLVIPINEIKSELGNLEQVKTEIKDTKELLGAELEYADDGVKVVSVEPDSPAELAGLEKGDVILNINGKDVSSKKDFASLQFNNSSKNDRAKLKILHNGKKKNVTIAEGEDKSDD